MKNGKEPVLSSVIETAMESIAENKAMWFVSVVYWLCAFLIGMFFVNAITENLIIKFSVFVYLCVYSLSGILRSEKHYTPVVDEIYSACSAVAVTTWIIGMIWYFLK